MKHYSEEHQWVEPHEDSYRVGLSEFAVSELGEITFVELPEVGRKIPMGTPLCLVESLKAASDVVSPVSGTVVAVNKALTSNPRLLNQSPEGDAWICLLADVPSEEIDKLMDQEAYASFLK